MTWHYAEPGILYVCPRCSEPELKAHGSEHGAVYECVNCDWLGFQPDEKPEPKVLKED